jgi:exonuclease VII small subunit
MMVRLSAEDVVAQLEVMVAQLEVMVAQLEDVVAQYQKKLTNKVQITFCNKNCKKRSCTW